MLTERFLNFVKAEFQDFWEKSAQKNSNEHEQGVFEQLYAYFLGQEKKTTSAQERTQAYQEYKQYRQQESAKKNHYYLEQEKKYYDALEIPVWSSWEEIRLAYKSAMKKYHPDKFAHDAEKQKIAQILTQKINEAYQYFEKKLSKN